jgi:hypothetical protein
LELPINGLLDRPEAERSGSVQKDEIVRSPVCSVIVPLSQAPEPVVTEPTTGEKSSDEVLKVIVSAPYKAKKVKPLPPIKRKRGHLKGSLKAAKEPPNVRISNPKSPLARETRQRTHIKYELRKSLIPVKNKDRTDRRT